MKINWNQKNTTEAIYAFLTIAACILFYMIISHFSKFSSGIGFVTGLLMPFVYGFVLAYLLNPILNWYDKSIVPKICGDKWSWKARRYLSVILTYITAAIILTIFLRVVIPQVIESISNLAGKAPAFVENALNWIQKTVNNLPLDSTQSSQLWEEVDKFVRSTYQKFFAIAGQILPFFINITSNLASKLLNWIVGLIVSIYMLAGKERFGAQIKKMFCAFLPRHWVENTMILASNSNGIFSGFISGKILDSFIIGCICFICLSLFRWPYAMLVSVIVGVTNVIPYFGPFIGAVPSAIILLTVKPTIALWFLVYIFILQQVDGNIIGPKILGKSTGLSAFWVVFAIMIFGGLFGFVGMFIGVPTFSVIYSLIKGFAERCLRQKGMPTATEEYYHDKS